MRRAKQLERGVGRLVGVALRLAILDVVEQPGEPGIVDARLDAHPRELGDQIGPSRLIGDQDRAGVADALGRHVLVGAGVFGQSGGVNARLGREGRGADVRRVPIGRPVQQFVEGVRNLGDPAQGLLGDADLESLGEIGLERQGGDQRDEIGVAAALAEAVQGSLDLPDAGPHRRERIGHRVASVVVRVNAEMVAGDGARDFGDDALDLVGKRAAVGVAKHHPSRARPVGGAGAVERVARIGLVAVEEMLAVDHRLAPGGEGRLDALFDAGEVFFQRAAERDADVIVPSLGDEHDGVSVRGDERGEAGIIGGRASGAFGHAEGAEPRALRRLALEEPRIERVGAGIAALDVVDAEPVEQRRDLQLVFEREVDAGGQCAVA